ncbi:hypothetical protein WN944_024682 [Citrus x changshan-huyou]|uniref:PTC1-like winged helix-turn-helix domain-containing protein n=1 Tax=Citrus x changshan-huyou TaxID=2935761 RepID=A0AAP0LUP6_9ROSI
MINSKTQEQVVENDAGKGASSGRQVLLPAASPICTLDAATSHIKVYSFYEIDPTKLPMNAPDQLKSIRIVMVSEKSRTGVAVRFPSVNSLRLHLCDGECGKEQGAKRVPSLDEKYLLEPEVAGEVLYRRVSGDEIGENKKLWSFWVVGFSGSFDVEIHQNKKGVGWSELLDSRGMLKWGKKKKVHYLKNEEALISYDGVKGGGGGEEEEEALKSGQLLVVEGETSELKRKLHEVNVLSNNIKKKKKTVVNKNSNSRWPKERYALAETNMWKIMKMKNAVFHKPMLRPELRAEARKLIGDTGLLDHLLKHMAGKVAPGGQDRFRRRHNADGAMEYWLESADLVNVRKQAGVQDPYWTPPPGWKPGDNPAQDPVCAAEFKQLKEDLAKIRMEMQDLFSKKQEDNLAIVATPSLNYGHDSFLLRLKLICADLLNKKAKLDENMMEISQSLCTIEEEMEKAKLAVGELNKPAESSLTSDDGQGGKDKTITGTPDTTKVKPEEKVAKIERLKSGFTMCKPQGSFLWPNMAMYPQPNKVVAQLEDLFLIPTPQSVSSSTASSSAHHLLPPLSNSNPLPNCPVKPKAERRPVTVALTAAVTKPTHPLPPGTMSQFETITSTGVITTDTSTKPSMIDLNEMPCPHTYQRRNQNETVTTNVIPCFGAPVKDSEISQSEQDERKEVLRECDQKQKGSSSSTSLSSSSSSTCLSRVS